MSEQNEPRLVTPVSFFGQKGETGPHITDFSPHPVSADKEAKEVNKTLTPAPKDESAVESADSLHSKENTSQEDDQQESPVQTEQASTEKLEAAAKASGKLSESNEEELTSTNQTPQEEETSSPSSSTEEKSTGFPMPPAQASPPTAPKTPKQ